MRNSKYKIFIISLGIILALSTPTIAEVELGGYYSGALIYIQNQTIGNPLNTLNKLRLKADYQPTKTVLLHLEPQFVVMTGFKNFPVEGATNLDNLIFDRAYLATNLYAVDLTIGKQRIAWGTGYFWNPTDIFNPFSLTIAEEEKQGVDALRATYHFGFASYTDMVVLSEKAGGQNKWAIKTKTNYQNYDLSASYINLGQGYMLGADFAGEVWDLGVRGEAAYAAPATSGKYIDLSLGGNYTFDNGLGIDLEFYRNGRGGLNKSSYDFAAWQTGSIQFLGKYYFALNLSKLLNELESIRGAAIFNLVDGGMLFFPSYTYNIWENVDLSVEAVFYSATPNSEWNPPPAFNPNGFIGSNLYFFRLKYSF